MGVSNGSGAIAAGRTADQQHDRSLGRDSQGPDQMDLLRYRTQPFPLAERAFERPGENLAAPGVARDAKSEQHVTSEGSPGPFTWSSVLRFRVSRKVGF